MTIYENADVLQQARELYPDVQSEIRKLLYEELNDPTSSSWTTGLVCTYIVCSNGLYKQDAKPGEEGYVEPVIPYMETPESLIDGLIDAIVEQTQKADRVSFTAGAALSYLDEIKFVGFAPKFGMDMALGTADLEDVRPVFDIWCQDDAICPEPTLAFRVAVAEDLTLRFAIRDVAFLRKTQPVSVTTPVASSSEIDTRLKARFNKVTKVQAAKKR